MAGSYELPAALVEMGQTACVLPAGFRFLVTDEMKMVRPVLLFLYKRYARSKNLWRKVRLSEHAACDDLYEWYSYLDIFNINWDDVKSSDLWDYRSRIENSVSPKTGRPYASNTIRRRLITIKAFQKWGFSERSGVGLLKAGHSMSAAADLGKADTVEKADTVLQSGMFEAGVLDVVPKGQPAAPNPFHDVSKLKRVLRALGPNPFDEKFDPRPARDRLVATFSVTTGTRLSETLSISLADVLALERPPTAERTASTTMILRETKGQVPRQIRMPFWLLDELVTYAVTERHQVVERTQSLGRVPAANLFLNGVDASDRYVGLALKARTVSRVFRSAILSCGFFTQTIDGSDPTRSERIVAQYTFHDLRHTFAIQQYFARKAAGDAEPWKIISVLLGHKSMKTTMDIYLSSVSISEMELSDIMSDFFNTLISPLGGQANGS